MSEDLGGGEGRLSLLDARGRKNVRVRRALMPEDLGGGKGGLNPLDALGTEKNVRVGKASMLYGVWRRKRRTWKGGGEMGRMTENMKSEAVRLYFEENREPDEIARQIGASEKQVKTILGDLKRLEAYRKKSEAAKLRAQICVYESAEEAARHQAALLSQSEGNDNIRQRAAKDILDRAGIRMQKDCGKDVVIRFAAGAPALGMPDGTGGKEEEQKHGDRA